MKKAEELRKRIKKYEYGLDLLKDPNTIVETSITITLINGQKEMKSEDEIIIESSVFTTNVLKKEIEKVETLIKEWEA